LAAGARTSSKKSSAESCDFIRHHRNQFREKAIGDEYLQSVDEVAVACRTSCSFAGFRGSGLNGHVGHVGYARTAQLFGVLPSLSGGFLLLFRVTVVRLGQINLLKTI